MAIISLCSAIFFSGAVFWRIHQNYTENAREQARYLKLIEQEVSKDAPDLERIISSVERLDQLNQTEKGEEGMAIIYAFLGAAFGGKFVQKLAEARGSQSAPTKPKTIANPGSGP
jgi:aromatic ring-opening dioxygenase catalytic subunit (LigB family)